jgi:hypothetical protein
VRKDLDFSEQNGCSADSPAAAGSSGALDRSWPTQQRTVNKMPGS